MGLSKSHFTQSQTYKQGKHPLPGQRAAGEKKAPAGGMWAGGGGGEGIGWQEPWRQEKENCEQRNTTGRGAWREEGRRERGPVDPRGPMDVEGREQRDK